MTKIEIAQLFEKYKSDFAYCCSIEKYEFVFQGSHDMLDSNFDQHLKELYKTITDSNSSEMAILLREFVSYIYHQHSIALNSPSKYGRKSAKQYLKVYNMLGGYLHFLDTKTSYENNVNATEVVRQETSNKPIKYPKSTEFNKPDINRNQVVALMSILKSTRVFNKDLTDTALGDSFGNMTGFGGDQLRKLISSLNTGDILFKKEEVDQLKDIMIKMTKALDELPLK